MGMKSTKVITIKNKKIKQDKRKEEKFKVTLGSHIGVNLVLIS
jgi:hypothetical protein